MVIMYLPRLALYTLGNLVCNLQKYLVKTTKITIDSIQCCQLKRKARNSTLRAGIACS